jgi:large subunit ribosomal protein L22
MPVNEAEAQLMIRSKRSAGPILKLLKSAVANMVNNRKIDADTLVIEKITVDGGPSMRRFLPRAMGRATPILKRTCHITLVLKETKKKEVARYNTVKPKNEKEAKKIAKETHKSKHDTKEPERHEAPAGEKKGFVKKMFTRKSV